MSKEILGPLDYRGYLRWKPGGRWMVVTGRLFTRHHRLSEARKHARAYRILGARVRRYHRADIVHDESGPILREGYR